MDNQNGFLKVSIVVLKIFSYIFGAVGIIGACIILFGKTPGSGKWASLGVLFMGGFYFFILYLVSEIVHVLIKVDDRMAKLSDQNPVPRKDIR
jgi:hypothetical protein